MTPPETIQITDIDGVVRTFGNCSIILREPGHDVCELVFREIRPPATGAGVVGQEEPNSSDRKPAFWAIYNLVVPASWLAFEQRTRLFHHLLGRRLNLRIKLAFRLGKLCKRLAKFLLKVDLFLSQCLHSIYEERLALPKNDVDGDSPK